MWRCLQGSWRPGAGTHLLFMVAEFTLLVLLFDFAVVHSGSFRFSARTLFFFFSSSFCSCRLSLLLRCLLLLLQDSSFSSNLLQKTTDRQTVRRRPAAPGYFGYINEMPRLNQRVAAQKWAVRGGARALRQSSPFPGKSCSCPAPVAEGN